jgi:hypothetical protein
LPDKSNGFAKSVEEQPDKPLIYLPPATVHGVVFEVLFAAAKLGQVKFGQVKFGKVKFGEVACGLQHSRTGPPPAPRAFARGVTNGPALNSARGGGAMLGMPPRGISR